jgi:hypothetical protein
MSTGNRPPAPTSRPAPPASGRPAPPATGRPAPPATGRPAPPPSSNSESSQSNSNCDNAIKLEAEGKYQEASLYYQECGDLNSATRCLKLALINQTNTTVNNIQYGDKNIHDSVVTGQE